MAGVSLFFISTASAYVLSGPHILHKMIGKLGKTGTLLVSGELKLYEEDFLKNYISVTETSSFSFPDKFRSDTVSGDTQKIFVSSFENSVTIVNEEVTSLKESIYDAYKDILLYRSDELIQPSLKRLGIDTSVSSVGRFHGRLVYVVGANYPDESVSQVMVDKKTFLPIRLILVRKSINATQNVLDVSYLDWKKKGKTWCPGKIQFFLDNRISREFTMTNMVVNPSLSESIFDISHLKTIYQNRVEENAEEARPEKVDEVQKTIDDFSKMYE
ncbi:MAG: hypothetical protein KJ737_27390 [Proteobacteria bacterium]|nr:hypothetical protein [Pseudomonadota bacterium]